jgi:hypothetical protein
MTLSKQLLAKKNRPAVVADLVQVVHQEVADKKGVSGVALKAGYGTAKKVVPNLVERVVQRLLPDFAVALDPFWKEFVSKGDKDFGVYLAAEGPAAAAALLAVTDAKVGASSRESIKKPYWALRGKADGHVQAALPRLGVTRQRHTTSAIG